MFADLTQPPLLPPLARFAIAMLIQFAILPLCRRLRLPAVVGLRAIPCCVNTADEAIALVCEHHAKWMEKTK
jgi:hypothetical protein